MVDTCKVKTFKKVATGLEYQAHLGRDHSQKVVNGVTEHCYRIASAVQLSNAWKGFVDTSEEYGGSDELRDFLTYDC